MFIYQLGNVVVHGFAEHSTPVSWRGSTQIGEQHSRVAFTNFYRLPGITNITLNGAIKCIKDENSIGQLENLVKLGGFPNLDIIGYLPNLCCRPGQHCTICEGHTGHTVHWWHTYGKINNVTRNYNLDTEHNEQLVLIGVTISLEANPYWTPLNKYEWFAYYGKDEIDSFNLILDDADSSDDETEDQPQVEAYINDIELYHHPNEVVLFHYNPVFKFYKKTFANEYELYNPIYWDDWNTELYVYGRSLSSSLTSYTLSSTWSGEVKTMHCFGNLPTSGILEIDVENETRPFNIESTHSEIDLSTIDDVLSFPIFGATGLTSDYLLYCATDDLSTSFLYRISTDELIEGFIPNWTYTKRCPGELFGLKSRVTITKPDVNITYGALHLFRKV